MPTRCQLHRRRGEGQDEAGVLGSGAEEHRASSARRRGASACTEAGAEQAGLVSVVVGAGAAWFGLYVNSTSTDHSEK